MTRIQDYFLIGDLHTAALVSNQGSIDWLCLPHFDSPSIFGSLLGQPAGSFRIDSSDYEISAQYMKDLPIVELSLQKLGVSIKVKDFMLPRPIIEAPTHYLIRQIEGKAGLGQIIFVYEPKTNYGQYKPQLEISDDTIAFLDGKYTVWLKIPNSSKIKKTNDGCTIIIDIAEGEKKNLVMGWSRLQTSHGPNHNFEKETINFWTGWVSQGQFMDFSRDNLIRSAITLKLMQFYPSGGIIAAPTTSLPDDPGGVRNWDYRYVWIRDATFAIYALTSLGYKDEAVRFFKFIEAAYQRSLDNSGGIKIMYGINGQEAPLEKQLEHLAGYLDSKPVRVGNNAAGQFQLDTYGALIDAYYFSFTRGLDLAAGSKPFIVYLVNKIKEHWQEKDSGIWEFRTDLKHYTYSKVMCWVGLNRALRLGDTLGIDEQTIKEWQALEEEISEWIWKNCFDRESNVFGQFQGCQDIDASNLLFVILQFLDKKQDVSEAIVATVRKYLGKKDFLVYRYKIDDGLVGHDRPFLLCSFWLISALAQLGKHDQAVELLKELESHMNTSGLLSEQMDPETFGYLGNFPQAFSHIGYIMSVYYINKYS